MTKKFKKVTVRGFKGQAYRTDIYDSNGLIAQTMERLGGTRFKLGELDPVDLDKVLTDLLKRGILESDSDWTRSEVDAGDLWLAGRAWQVTDPDEIHLDVQHSTISFMGLSDREIDHDVVVLFPAAAILSAGRRRR